MPDTPFAPQCDFLGCLDAPVVQWQRHPTEAEFAAVLGAEQARRDQILAHADPDWPTPQFGPMPAIDDTTVAVRTCAGHAIGLNAAAHLHQADCAAPDCACDLTPAPQTVPPQPDLYALPAGWAPTEQEPR
ncbi:hypothetical protein ACPC54_17995 [Kitasatospora sp. NPDC094028]